MGVREKSFNRPLMLGTSANLLHGYDPAWLSPDKWLDALFRAPEQPLEEIEIAPLSVRGKWGWPEVSLHDTPEALLSTLLPYRILENPGSTGVPEVQSGPLLLEEATRQKDLEILSRSLGVNLAAQDTGFVLVTLRREDGVIFHPACHNDLLIHPDPVDTPEEFGLKKEFRKNMAALKRVKVWELNAHGGEQNFLPDLLTLADAEEYLDFFERHGTHFISKITQGDGIFQVFAMPTAAIGSLKALYAEHPEMLTGPDAVWFCQYTAAYQSESGRGQVREYGTLSSFSRSAALARDIKAGAWRENTFALRDSIFAPFRPGSALDLQGINARYSDAVPVAVHLSSQALFAEQSRRHIWQRVLCAGLIQKHGRTVKPNFVEHCPHDFPARFRDDGLPGFLSNIATPSVNAYKKCLNLSEVVFVAPEETKELTLCSNYLYGSKEGGLPLPGRDILLASQVFDLESRETVSAIHVAAGCLDEVTLLCRHFYGALLVEEAGGKNRFTVVDGLRYESASGGPGGRVRVKAVSDLRGSGGTKFLGRLASSLHFSCSSSEAVLGFFAGEDLPAMRAFVKDSLLWVAQVIPADTRDLALLNLRVRALDLAESACDGALGAFVPLLPFDDYNKQSKALAKYLEEIDRNIRQFQSDIKLRKLAELVIDVGGTLNENIIQSGKLLSGYIESSLAQQRDLTAYYEGIAEQKRAELKLKEDKLRTVQIQLDEQQSEMKTAVARYEAAVKTWEVNEGIRFGLGLATSLFSLGTSIVIPASAISSVKELGLMAQRIQKFLSVSNNFYKLYTDTKNYAENLKNANAVVAGLESGFLDNQKWDELGIRFSEVLATGPSSPDINTAKASLTAAFQLYTLKGKALASTKSELQQLARDIYSQENQKALLEKQAARLEKLTTSLTPKSPASLKKQEIDLVGASGSLSLIHSQTLGMLSRIFTLQDQALRYTFLQPPTVMQGFDLMGVRSALATQIGKTNSAREKLAQHQPSTTKPITIVAEVPAEELRGGGGFKFTIRDDAPEFWPYINLRVNSVTARVDGIKNTAGGSYLVSLSYSGSPFMDRNTERETVVFNTPSRERTYEYSVKGNKPLFSDKGKTWSDGVNRVTPFSAWEISLPKGRINSDLEFESSLVKVVLTFVLEARIADANGEKNQAAGVQDGISVSDLCSVMHSKTVLNGWDVVFNMGAEKINKVLAEQYAELKKRDAVYGGKISGASKTYDGKYGESDIDMWRLLKFDLSYGYPCLEFLANNTDTTKLILTLTAGECSTGQMYRADHTEENKETLIALATLAKLPSPASWVTVDPQTGQLTLEYYRSKPQVLKDASLDGFIKLECVSGLVKNEKNDTLLSVVLDMAKGTFDSSSLTIALDDVQKVAFSDAIKAYFLEHPVSFIINSINISTISVLPDLKPSQFLFVTNKSKNMLQLFIQTNGRRLLDRNLASLRAIIGDPIPTGMDFSLMINSRIILGSVLPASLTGKDWTISGTNPNDPEKAWSASLTKAEFSGDVDLSGADWHTKTNPHCQVSYYYTYKPHSGNPVAFDLNGLSLTPHSDGTLKLGYEKTNTFYFDEYEKVCSLMCGGYKKKRELSADYNLTVSAFLISSVAADEKDITLAISSEAQKSVTIDAKVSSGGCSCDGLEVAINAQLRNTVPEVFRTNLNMSFTAVSFFALQNLLFTSDNRIRLKEAYIPGDMLVVGLIR